MNSQQLKYFVTVAICEHLTKASEELNISQPALSNAIARMEDELGIKLFDRVGRNIYLNEAGKAYLPYAKDVLDTLNEGQAVVSSMISGMSEHITIQTMPLIMFPGLLDIILNVCPIASILPINVTTSTLIENLVLAKTDLCITHKLLSSNGINVRLLKSDRAVIVVSKKHFLLANSSVTIDDLKDQIFISSTQYGGLSSLLQTIFKDAPYTPKIGYYINNFNEIFDYIKTGKCIATTMLSAYNDLVRYNPPDQIAAIPIEGDAGTINSYLYWYKPNKKEIIHDLKKVIIEYFGNENNNQKNP